MPGLSRRNVLLGTLAAGALGSSLRADARSGPRYLVVVMADGGWDLTFTFDPKPGREGVHGPYVDLVPDRPGDLEEIRAWGDIEVTCNAARRPAVTDYFDRWGSLTSVVRGVWVGSVSHWIGHRRILSGTDDPAAPDVITRVGAAHAEHRPLGAVDLSHVGRFGSLGRMVARGGTRGQLGQLLQPDTRFAIPEPPATAPQGAGLGARPDVAVGPEARRHLDRWLARQTDRERNQRVHDAGREAALRDREEARERASELQHAAPDLRIPAPGQQSARGMARFAASLLASGTAGSVIIDSGSRWDTHTSQVLQHGNFDRVFSGLDTLLGELDAANILGDTLVVAMSEMMRTPWRNTDGGTEHWPYTGLMLAGGGVAGGRVHGATDDRLVGVPGAARGIGGLLTYREVMAGVLAHVGLPPGELGGDFAGIVPLSFD